MHIPEKLSVMLPKHHRLGWRYSFLTVQNMLGSFFYANKNMLTIAHLCRFDQLHIYADLIQPTAWSCIKCCCFLLGNTGRVSSQWLHLAPRLARSAYALPSITQKEILSRFIVDHASLLSQGPPTELAFKLEKLRLSLTIGKWEGFVKLQGSYIHYLRCKDESCNGWSCT